MNAAEKENRDYKTARTEWEKIYGDKTADSMSIRDRLRQKEQIVKEIEVDRDYQARQKDKGVSTEVISSQASSGVYWWIS